MRALLLGGQACVKAPQNLAAIPISSFSQTTTTFADCRPAVATLDAAVIAVPPFGRRYLEAGHTVHFRCRGFGVAGLRVDVMARHRGLPDFETLWSR